MSRLDWRANGEPPTGFCPEDLESAEAAAGGMARIARGSADDDEHGVLLEGGADLRAYASSSTGKGCPT
jgi:hypothetical protein